MSTKRIGDPLEQAALTGKIGSRASSNPATQKAGHLAVQPSEVSDVQSVGNLAIRTTESLATQQSGFSEVQNVDSPAVQKTGSSKVQTTKGGRVQQTVYLPPDLAKWVKIQAIEENREISEIAADALEMYRRSRS